MSTPEQDIIRAFNAGGRSAVAKALIPVPVLADEGGAWQEPPAQEQPEPSGKFGLGFSPETRAAIAKRMAQDVARDARHTTGEVSKSDLRRDILGSDATRRLRAQTKFRSANSGPPRAKSSFGKSMSQQLRESHRP